MSEAGVHQEAPVLPTTEDPKEFFDRFRDSKFYKDAFDGFYTGKTPAHDVTEEEKALAFLESDVSKIALIDFTQQELGFHYNSANFTPESRKAIGEYIATVKDQAEMIREGAGQHEIATMDGMRFLNHVAAAKQLAKDGIAPTEKMGRALARIILVDKKLDTLNSLKEPDVQRLTRKIGGA